MRRSKRRLLKRHHAPDLWEGWTTFFLEAVATSADEAVATAKGLFALTTNDRDRVLAAPSTTVMGLRLLELLPAYPIPTVVRAAEVLDTTRPTATKAIGVLQATGVLVEITGKRRDRTYHYEAYLDLLKAGTET